MAFNLDHIICGSDFSETCKGSIQESFRLAAGRPESKVSVVHVTATPPSRHSALTTKLADWLKTLPQSDALAGRITPRVVQGRIAQALAREAEAQRADLIVVGPLRKGFLQAIMGGIAEQLFSSTNHTPVLATSQPSEGGYRHILVPVDFGPGSERALSMAADLIRGVRGAVAEDAHIELIHVYNFPGGIPAGSVRHELEAKIRVKLEAELRGLAQKLGCDDLVTHCHVAFGAARDAIVAEAETLGVDLICMSSSGGGDVQRALLGSTASGVLVESKRPMLVFPPV